MSKFLIRWRFKRAKNLIFKLYHAAHADVTKDILIEAIQNLNRAKYIMIGKSNDWPLLPGS